MENIAQFVKGTCTDMCPIEERNIREREKLLHILEIKPGTENNPKADKNRTVKCFTRSAAGVNLIKETNLRTFDALLETVSYLLYEVLDNTTLPLNVLYDFITDRLRAVKQDMIIQNFSIANNIALLQPIVRFHAYMSYRLCEEHKDKFDSVLNRTHLMENLKRLLYYYDKYDEVIFNNCLSDELLLNNRVQIEALYVLLNLGDQEPLLRVLSLPVKWRKLLVTTSFSISLLYLRGNYIKMCKFMKNLPPLLLAVTALSLPQLRRKAYKIMSFAYNSPQVYGYSINDLKFQLLYDSLEDLKKDCEYYGLTVNGDMIMFSIKSFNNKEPTVPRFEKFVDKKLSEETLQSLIIIDN